MRDYFRNRCGNKEGRTPEERPAPLLVVEGALPLVALVLDVPHGAEYLSERTFQVAEDASGLDALVLQCDVRGQDQVAREPEPFEGEIHHWVLHVHLQPMAGW